MKWAGAVLLIGLASASPSRAEPIKLWHAYRGGEETALEKAVSLFTAQTSIPVQILAVPYDVFASKLESAITHGQGPDVFIFGHERLESFQRQGLIAPVDDFIHKESYFPSAMEAMALRGKTYGYPLSFKCLALYLNNRLIPKPPATTRDLLELSRVLGSPRENRFGLAYESGNFYYHVPFLFGFGGRLFDENGRADFQADGMARSLAFVKGLQESGIIPQEASGALVTSLFNEGRAGMVISGPWFAGSIARDISFSVVPLPLVSETGLPMRPFLGVEAALVSARSTQPPRARELARFLSLGEAAQLRALIGRQIPAELRAYDSPELKAQAYFSSFGKAAQNAMPMPNSLEMSRVWEPMRLVLRGVLQGGVAPERAGALANRRYRALYRPRPAQARPFWYIVALVSVLAAAAIILGRRRPGLPVSERYPDMWRAAGYMAPAAAGLLVLVVIPFVFGIALSLFHHEAGSYSFVGLANFSAILASKEYRITEPLSFYFTLLVTVAWTVINVALHVGIGLFLALMLKSPLLRLRGLFRVLLILPWAIPNYITALMWKGMFHSQFGAINGLLALLGVAPISWFTRFSTAFAANVAANTWLGFPFMMVVSLGALQSIPADLYEAAEVDGASGWQKFRRITLPLLRPALLPSVILGSLWTFNMFNIIYLVSGGEPGGGTDILVSEAYRWAFERNQQYGFAAAYAVLIFIILLGYSTLTQRWAGERQA